MIFKLDGIRAKLEPLDLDKDGIAGEIETVKQASSKSDWIDVKETTELGEALSHQNKDSVNDAGMSNVDFISRINSIQHATMSAVTYIARAGVISGKGKDLVLDLMRKAVSLDGKGRKEFVEVVTGREILKQQKAMAAVTGNVQK